MLGCRRATKGPISGAGVWKRSEASRGSEWPASWRPCPAWRAWVTVAVRAPLLPHLFRSTRRILATPQRLAGGIRDLAFMLRLASRGHSAHCAPAEGSVATSSTQNPACPSGAPGRGGAGGGTSTHHIQTAGRSGEGAGDQAGGSGQYLPSGRCLRSLGDTERLQDCPRQGAQSREQPGRRLTSPVMLRG